MKPIVEYVDSLHEMTWLVLQVYLSDNELVEKYHIKAGIGNLEDCVIDTIEKLTSATDLRFYSMWDGANLIGYFGTEEGELGTELVTFGIMHNQRTKEVSIAFWNVIKDIAGNELICALYSRNKPAIEFISKVNHRIILTGKDDQERNEEYKIFELKLS